MAVPKRSATSFPREAAGRKLPKIGILVLAYDAAELIHRTIERIPLALRDLIEEIFVFDDFSMNEASAAARQLLGDSGWKDKIKIFRNPTTLGYGSNQKVGLSYALAQGLDYVVLLNGDGRYAPEALPDLLAPILSNDADAVLGYRKASTPLTAFQNLVLGLGLREYRSGLRIYSTATLESIAFLENSDDLHFDTEIIIQLRIANARISEVPLPPPHGRDKRHVGGVRYGFNACKAVLQYRLHQLHFIRRSKFLLRQKVVYTRKRSPYSSHQQVIDLVERAGLALDLGSSQGLVTEDLLRKGVESIAVDLEDPANVSGHFKQYIRCDLESYEALSFAREFDYVILADVIEHLKSSKGLLKFLRRFLKVEGKLIVSVPNIAIWFYRLSLLMGRFNYGPKGILDETHTKLYTVDTIQSLLSECGYVVRRKRYTSVPFEVVFESTGRSRSVRALDWIYYQLVRFWPRLFAYQIVVEAGVLSLEADQGEGRVQPTSSR